MATPSTKKTPSLYLIYYVKLYTNVNPSFTIAAPQVTIAQHHKLKIPSFHWQHHPTKSHKMATPSTKKTPSLYLIYYVKLYTNVNPSFTIAAPQVTIAQHHKLKIPSFHWQHHPTKSHKMAYHGDSCAVFYPRKSHKMATPSTKKTPSLYLIYYVKLYTNVNPSFTIAAPQVTIAQHHKLKIPSFHWQHHPTKSHKMATPRTKKTPSLYLIYYIKLYTNVDPSFTIAAPQVKNPFFSLVAPQL